VKIRVDADRCQGHQRCFALAPDLFEVDDYGTSSPAGTGTIAPGQENLARRVMANCPEYAIEIVEQ